MREFEFNVYDTDGLWGSMRVTADNADNAAVVIREDLRREEVEPNGTLKPDFQLRQQPPHPQLREG